VNCIYLAVYHQTNRQLLKQWLAESYSIIEINSFEQIQENCALIIIDTQALGGQEASILRFRKQQPFVPILLITPVEWAGLAIRQLWKTVDELIISPIKKVEMFARVHSLMQMKELHTRLQHQSQELLHRSEERYRSLFENNHTVILIINPDSGAIVSANPSASEFYGWSQQQLQNLNMAQIIVQGYDKMQWSLEQKQQSYECQHYLANGSIRDVEVFSGVIPIAESSLLYVFVHDITERKKTLTELQISAIVFEAQEGVIISDASNRILRVNLSFTKITHYTAEEVIGKNPCFLQSDRHNKTFYAAMWESIKNTGAWKGETWNHRKTGEAYLQYLNITAVHDSEGNVTNYVATFTDITQSKKDAEKIEWLAFYDPLTGLSNRRRLYDRLKQALSSSQHSGRKGTLLFLDIDHFKNLNDTLGHDKGDLLLRMVAKRLESCVSRDDTVARLGGDEFVVMLENLSETASEAIIETEMIGNRILSSLNQSYQLNSYYYHITLSIGATLFNGQELSVDELLKQADIAMYQAKASGRNTLRFFDPQMQNNITMRVQLEADLRQALTENQFTLHYQPQVYFDGKITGAEVLIRWQHPRRGFISPTDFIPLAEETHLILPIGQWVLETACAQLKQWETDQHTQHLQLAVNVSACQFHQPDFVENVCQILHSSKINPTKLKLELTETMVLDNIEETILKMNALKQIGVRFSMDDFGTGYSSFAYLTKLPIDQLKIDQSFVRNIGMKSSDGIIIQTIIGMAKNLTMQVIAEGVETETQRIFLEQNDCQFFQGYLFSKPVTIEQFEQLFENTM
jgi:diguanylate cyclase (GGDEF)-like protein/PAS domain S-box-containing protein